VIVLPRTRQGPLRALAVRMAAALVLVLVTVAVIYLDRDAYRDANEDGLTLLDCFYYTVVSLSTTGYGDITPVTEHARLVNVGIVVGAAVAAYTVARIVRPLREVGTVLSGMAGGDLTGTAAVQGSDEIGRMATELGKATTSVRETVRAVAETAAGVASSAAQLAATSTSIAATADDTSGQSQTVAAAASQVSDNVQSVVAGAEQMSAAIREIAQSSAQAAQVASSAEDAANSASGTVAQLDASSAEIGNVLNLITSIAEQTNLLALNATIEAARAGDAGKGFAVVASEVKDLAQETARATEDISHRVEAIQTDARAAAASIGEISRVIEQINQYQTTIAAAVEQQTATTGEISRNVAQAATGTIDIAHTIGGVADGAATTSAGMTQNRAATAELATAATSLQQLVQRFRY
jgi:methyl-accepting chemotaxis protein